MEFSIKFDDREIKKKLGSLQEGLKSYKTPLEAVGTDLIDFYGQKVFKTQGKALGSPWKGLSSGTLLAREHKQGYYAKPPREKGKILIWTGRLQDSFRKKAERFKLTIDNKDPKFKHHQLGGKTPKRPMLGLTKEIITSIVEDLNAYIRKLVK